jgi:hypothetical protein
MIQYLDSVPYMGEIDFRIYKMYCNGNKSGDYSLQGAGNDEGYWFTGMYYTYKFENAYDRVEVVFKVESPVSGIDDENLHKSYYYTDVYDFSHDINLIYEITLPWRSDQK